MNRRLSLLCFQAQDGLVRFWRRHPGIMALTLALLTLLPWALGFVGAVVVGMGEMHILIKGPLMLASMLGTGFITATCHDRFCRPIAGAKQAGLMDAMGAKIISGDRRLCRLEAWLILRTQGSANQARAEAMAMEIALPPADSGQAPSRGRL